MSGILLIGDNLLNVNWGARGATLSLMEILEQQYRISGTIGGRHYNIESAGYGILPALTPARYSRFLLSAYNNRHRRRIFDLYYRLERRLGARDYIDGDPARTAANIIRYRSSHPELKSLYSAVQQAEAVFVNGEGDIVFTTPPRREVLFILGMLALSQQLGKPTYLVNAMLSDCPVNGRCAATAAHTGRLLERCATVSVRDPESLLIGKEIAPNARFIEAPDSLFSWQERIASLSRSFPSCGDLFIPWGEGRELYGQLDFGGDYVCIGGGAGIPANEEDAVAAYRGLVRELRALQLPIYLIISDGRDSFLRKVAALEGAAVIPAETPIVAAACILARARLLVSGRYHPTILASLGGTPSIYLESGAHKMKSLQTLLTTGKQVTFPALPDAGAAAEIAGLAAAHLHSGDDTRTRIIELARNCSDRARRLPFLLTAGTDSPAVRAGR